MRNARALALIVVFVAVMSLPWPTVLHAQAGCGVVLWNTLGSDAEIARSEIGPGGEKHGGSFAPGPFPDFGHAFVNSDPDVNAFALTFPAAVVPKSKGTLELWAKLNNFPSQPFDSATLIFYGPPFALPQFHWRLGFGSNDGCGGSGLFSTVGVATNAYCSGLVDTATGYRTFDSLLGDRAAWHHYAMVWNEAGIAELGGRKLYVYLDGNLQETPYYHDGSPWNAFPNGSRLAVTYFYHISGASIAVDNLIIWDDVKTDFSHRFNEAPSCDPAPVTVGGAVTGLRTTKAWCINNTMGASVVIPLAGATSWDCEAAGLEVSEGDSLSLRVRGFVKQDATDLSGAVTGMTPSSGGCSNLTTGQSVTFQHMQGATAASCVAAGLVVHPEDSVQMRVRGVTK